MFLILTEHIFVIKYSWEIDNGHRMSAFHFFPLLKQFNKETIDRFLKVQISINVKFPHLLTYLNENKNWSTCWSKHNLQQGNSRENWVKYLGSVTRLMLRITWSTLTLLTICNKNTHLKCVQSMPSSGITKWKIFLQIFKGRKLLNVNKRNFILKGGNTVFHNFRLIQRPSQNY